MQVKKKVCGKYTDKKVPNTIYINIQRRLKKLKENWTFFNLDNDNNNNNNYNNNNNNNNNNSNNENPFIT